MKSEEQFLLNHMYREGYTDEEMHNRAVLKVIRNSLSFRVKYAAYIFKEIAKAAVIAFKEWATKVIRSLSPVLGSPAGKSPLRKNEQSIIPITMQHQVIDRKPRQLIKKIIR